MNNVGMSASSQMSFKKINEDHYHNDTNHQSQ